MNRKLVTALAASALVALSGCGSPTDAKSTARTTPAASAGSHTLSSSMAVRGGVVDGQMLSTMMADAMVASKTTHVMVSTDGKPTGEGDYEFGTPVSLALKTSQQGLSLEIVQVRGVLYIKGIPGLPKPWLRVDPKGTDAVSKAMASMGDLSKSQDPRATISMMKGVKGRDLGTAKVGGVSTRHYEFEIGMSAYGKFLPAETLKLLQGTIDGPIVTGYWVGQDNLPRKVTSVVTMGSKKMSTEVTYNSWGKPVNIAAPPAAQVVTPPRK